MIGRWATRKGEGPQAVVAANGGSVTENGYVRRYFVGAKGAVTVIRQAWRG